MGKFTVGLDESATNSTMKKAYHKLSLRWHPDKLNQETLDEFQLSKEEGEAKFIDISKAYKTLTDKESYENWKEFGHPDGKQSFTMILALPSWLVGNGRNLTLLFYALIFGVGLPIVVARWWSAAKSHSKNKILNSTMSIFYRDLKEDLQFRQTIELLSKAEEWQAFKLETLEGWDELIKSIKERFEDLKVSDRSIVLGKKVIGVDKGARHSFNNFKPRTAADIRTSASCLTSSSTCQRYFRLTKLKAKRLSLHHR
jgi:translocation protein SEC63